MKLQDLFEMPQFSDRELGADPSDEIEPMKPFIVSAERYGIRYDELARDGNTVVALSKDHGSAIVAVKTIRHDKVEGYNVLGLLQLKEDPNLGINIDPKILKANKMLQVTLVTVADEAKFMGVGSFLYSSLAQAGYTIISDTHHYKGGKALWKKLARSKLRNEVVYVMNKGQTYMKDGKPVEYDGNNIPDSEIWSSDEKHKFVLLIYKTR